MKYLTIIDNEQYEIEIDNDGRIFVNGEERQVDFLPLGPSLHSIVMNDQSMQVVIDEEMGNYEVLMDGRLYESQVLDERALMMAQRRGGLGGGSGDVNAPMPGLIVAVSVEEGQAVAQGDTVVILESMKMQNELKSPIDGVVESIKVEAGQTVDKNDPLIAITPNEE